MYHAGIRLYIKPTPRSFKLLGSRPKRADAGLCRGMCSPMLSMAIGPPQHTPVTRAPSQSVAMHAGTDGLPPLLDIDCFNVSRQLLTPHPAGTIQGYAGSLVDASFAIVRRLALLTMLPFVAILITLQESSVK